MLPTRVLECWRGKSDKHISLSEIMINSKIIPGGST